MNTLKKYCVDCKYFLMENKPDYMQQSYEFGKCRKVSYENTSSNIAPQYDIPVYRYAVGTRRDKCFGDWWEPKIVKQIIHHPKCRSRYSAHANTPEPGDCNCEELNKTKPVSNNTFFSKFNLFFHPGKKDK